MSEDDQTSILKVLVQLRDEVTDPLKQVNDRFSEMAENFASIGMAAGEVFAGYEALKTVIEPAAAMQEQMVSLKEATLANADAMEKYKHQADEVGTSLPLKGGAEEAMQAMTELYKTFRDDGAIKEQTETAAKLAVVMGDTAPLAAKVLSSAVQNLGDTSRPVIDQMKEFGDEIAVLQARFPMGSGGLMRMSMALRMLGTAAQVNNVAQKTMLALMAEGNRINLGGPRGSGPILAGIVNSLLKMKDGRYEMEKYGLQVVKTTDGHVNLIKTLEKMSELSDKQKRSLESSMGSQGANVALLIKHMDDLKEAYNEIDHASGQLDQDAKDRAATFDAHMQEMKSAWQEFKESIGTRILPDLTTDINQMTEIINKMNEFSDKHPTAAKVVGRGLEFGVGAGMLAAAVKVGPMMWKGLGGAAAYGWARSLFPTAAKTLTAREAMYGGGRIAEAAGLSRFLPFIGEAVTGGMMGWSAGHWLQRHDPIGFEAYQGMQEKTSVLEGWKGPISVPIQGNYGWNTEAFGSPRLANPFANTTPFSALGSAGTVNNNPNINIYLPSQEMDPKAMGDMVEREIEKYNQQNARKQLGGGR